MAQDAYWVIRTAGAAAPRVPFWEAPEAIWRRDVSDAIAALNASPSRIPGEILRVGWATIEPGWLFCDGSELARADYPALFAKIGTRFGAGDGTTTFNIPTQAQAGATVTTDPPAQTVTGGSVEPTTPPSGGEVGSGSGGGNVVTGGRPGRGPDIVGPVQEQ